MGDSSQRSDQQEDGGGAIKLGKQVDISNYRFESYMPKWRWASLWHQLDEIRRLQPGSILEVGAGLGLLKKIAKTFGIEVQTLDHDPDLKPDYVGTITALPFTDSSYDLVCAFQVLEHLPYEQSQRAFAEMARVSCRHVLISLPDARPAWRYALSVPYFGMIKFLLHRPQLRMPIHEFDGQHYWEINTQGILCNGSLMIFLC